MRRRTIIGPVALSKTSAQPSSRSFQDVLQSSLFEVYLTIEVSRCIAACDAGSWQETDRAGRGRTYEENNRHRDRSHSLALPLSIYPARRSSRCRRNVHHLPQRLVSHCKVVRQTPSKSLLFGAGLRRYQ